MPTKYLFLVMANVIAGYMCNYLQSMRTYVKMVAWIDLGTDQCGEVKKWPIFDLSSIVLVMSNRSCSVVTSMKKNHSFI